MQAPLSREGTVQRALALSHQTIIDCWMKHHSVAASADALNRGKPVYRVCDSAYPSGKLAMRSKELPPELMGTDRIEARIERWESVPEGRLPLQHCCNQIEDPPQDRTQENLEENRKGPQTIGNLIFCFDHPRSSVWRNRAPLVTCTPSL